MKAGKVGSVFATAAFIVSLAGCGHAANQQEQADTTQRSSFEVAQPTANEEYQTTETPTEQAILLEEFAEPGMRNRPLTRWWVPGSQMDEAEVEHEIESMVEAGFGGAEIVPVSTAGGDGEGELDWGSDEWKAITKHILEVAGEHDFTIDFTMTPAWPLALPGITDADDPAQGAQMEMDGAHVDVEGKAGEETTVELPVNQEAIDDAAAVEGTVELVGVTVARYGADGKTLLWDSAQALDLATVTGDGAKSIAFTPEEDGTYLVYAWYQHPAGNKKYGNIQLDHFSREAADALTSYWDENLVPYYGDAWKSVRSLFIDSLEFETQADWTYGIQDAFKARFGYDVTPYLPTIYDEGGNWEDGNWGATGNYMGEPVPEFQFDKNSQKVLNDWRELLTELYETNHVQLIAEWAEANGVTLRYQTSYGKDMETAQSALYPDIPETESLFGNDHMDFYRLQAGAVHAMDRSLYSMETAAEWTETWNPKKDDGNYGTRGNGELNSGNYEQTFLDHIWHDQRAFASGVNQVVFHGFPYGGQYDGGVVDGVEWPGFTGFESSRWSNSWGERQPLWMFANTYLDFVARNQYVLRQGVPKVDVAVYRHSYYEVIDFWGPDKLFDTTALEQAGYSYDFVAPATLALDNMVVTDGVLDADGTSYKALIVNQEDALPSSVVDRLNEYAEAGLTIVFVGEPASTTSSMEDADIAEGMEKLLANENVKTVASVDDVLGALKDASIAPAASYEGQTLLAAHRADEARDYYFLYNYAGTDMYRETHDAKAVKTTVTLQGTGTPYVLDAWTGKTRVAEGWKATDGGVAVDVTIAPNDSTIIVLCEEELVAATEAIEPMKGSVEVGDWNLTVESWTPGATVLDIEKTPVEVGALDELKPWNELGAKLEHVSGVGTYTATFTMPESFEAGQAAWLHMGHVKDAFGVKVNGQGVLVDQASGDANITELLKPGENQIEVTVASSLLNAILENNKDFLNDDGRVLDDRTPSGYGLTEQVTIDGNATRA